MPIPIHWPLVLLALGCEYVDSTLGMGYGTTLTPILLLMGYEPAHIVPSVLLSEFLTGVLAGIFHHGLGNVSFKPGSRPLKVALVLAMCSVVGTLAAVFTAVNIPRWMLKTYIGVLVLSMGIGILVTINKTFAFSWKRIIGLGLVAAFNKGLSGGGYGPLVTGAGNGAVDWGLAPSLILGAVLSVPFAALTVKKMPTQKLRWAIGITITALGLFTLVKLVL
jgi:uncharacterized membrane protein YfcA